MSAPKWRGPQSLESKREAKARAERWRTDAYRCRCCGWMCALDGLVYDEAMLVCGYCAARLVNLFERKHAGVWARIEITSDADFALFDETRQEADDWHARYNAPSKKKARISNKLRLRIYERDGFKCVYCRSRKDLSLDHVRAESQGGSTDDGNLVTCCRSCNSKKMTQSLADFWEQRP